MSSWTPESFFERIQGFQHTERVPTYQKYLSSQRTQSIRSQKRQLGEARKLIFPTWTTATEEAIGLGTIEFIWQMEASGASVSAWIHRETSRIKHVNDL